MRNLAIVAVATLSGIACATSPPAVEGSPPLRFVAISRLPEQPAHGHEAPVSQPPGPVDRSDPVAVAVALIASGLVEQGLEVVDLETDTLTATRSYATVRVAATHRGDEAEAPHTSVYDLELARDAEESWRLVDFRQSQ